MTLNEHFAIVVFCSATVTVASANDVYSTSFNDYANGTLSGQLAWIGVAGTWAVSASVNSGQTGFSVVTNDGALFPPSGAGKMVRMTTSRFANDRTKAWLDLANSGKWTNASAGGNGVLETTFKMYVPSGALIPCNFGIMVSKSSSETAGGMLVNGQTGAISYIDNGYAASNRYPVGSSVTLNAWHSFSYRWNVATGAATIAVDGIVVSEYITTLTGGLYAVNLFSTNDITSGTTPLNVVSYADDLSIQAVPPISSCLGDLNQDGQRDGADLGSLLGAWGTNGADLNADGTTDGADLGLLLGNWGACSS